jgi:putative ABC transport system permease protein
MTAWLLWRTLRRAPRRLLLEATGVAFPVALLAATLLFVDQAVHTMTAVALRPVLTEMRVVARSLDADIAAVSGRLAGLPDVQRAEPFAAVNVVVAPGTSGAYSARLFAVDPSYLNDHPWLRVVSGDLAQGALLDQSLLRTPGFDAGTSVSIALPGDAPPLDLTVPVAGSIDLRSATPWFAIPYGDVQGDIVSVPRSIVIDRTTFDARILPVLRGWAEVGGLPPFDPASGELPPATLESHVSIDHAAYPPDPGQALLWSGQVQRLLGREAGAPVVVADDASELLAASQDDATNAKILFLLLGLPGVLVAGALGLAVASTLVAAERREEGLLRLRGADSASIVRLAAGQSVAATLVGTPIGLAVAVAAVWLVTGHLAGDGVPIDASLVSLGLGILAGALTTLVRIVGLRRAARRTEVVDDRRLAELGWSPLWRRARLDLVAIVLGLAILGVSAATGGLRPGVTQGPTLALSFYVLMAPILLWIGATLLLIRILLAGLGALTRPERARPLRSWSSAVFRWLGRRPARMAVALMLASLAVGFATLVLSFAATYDATKDAEARAAIGADLRLTPADPRTPLPALGPQVAATTPVRLVPARLDSDRKTILALDLPSYLATATASPVIIAGEGPAALAQHPDGVLVDTETAQLFEIGPGDALPVSIFPDDFESAKDLELQVVGVFSAFPPTTPPAELVTAVGTLPRASLVPPDFHLARLSTPDPAGAAAVAEWLRATPVGQAFGISTAAERTQRGLTALNLAGLSGIESTGAGLMAALGLAVLGVFLILERRREIAVLRSVGADNRQILVAPALEAGVAVLGSVAIGVPVGLGLGVLAVRVLGLFFTLPPPLLVVPIGGLAALVTGVVGASVLALSLTVLVVGRARVAAALRGT